MKSLRDVEDLDEFMRLLPIWMRIWRRGVGGKGVARRRANALRRQHVRMAKLRFFISRLPRPVAATAASVWQRSDPMEVKLVLPPAGSDAGEDNQQPQSVARSVLRRYLRRAITETSLAEIDLVNAGNASARRLPPLAQAARGGRLRMRGIYLEAVGAAILPSLTEAEERELESLGARVFSNHVITLEQKPTDFRDDAVARYWHLGKFASLSQQSRLELGKGTTVGILDTGIDASHPEFAHVKIDFCAFDGAGRPAAMPQARDFGSHGTHVSALCAGMDAGVAVGADLAVAAVLTKTDTLGRSCGTLVQFVAGLNWLAKSAGRQQSGVDVINASLTLTGLSGEDAAALYATIDQIQRINRIVMIAAIGNEGRQFAQGTDGIPGRFDTVVGVGAIDERFKVAKFSNWGTATGPDGTPGHAKPDLVAPGVAVRSAMPGNRYQMLDGSSMASPLVAAAAAIMIGRDNSLRDDPARLTKKLLALTSFYAGWDHSDHPKVGKGFLNLDELV
jgi:hypothetical protein